MNVSRREQREGGITLIEIAIVLVLVGLAGSVAMPSLNRIQQKQALRDSAIIMKGALEHARSEAIRSGSIRIVFFQEDAEGQPLKDQNGNRVPILVLDDGRPGSANQNCKIDSGESFVALGLASGIDGGVTSGAANAAPSDQGTGDFTTGSSFTEPGGNQAHWVLFRPEGTPRSFDASCNIGGVGSGTGSFYLTNGERASAITVTPMGAGRLYTWAGGWSH